MTIFNDFKSQSFVKPYGNKGLLAVEFNGKSGVQAEEIVTDLDGDGKNNREEFLDFIVNHVPSLPVIKAVKKVIKDNRDENKDVINALKKNYIPKLDIKISELINAEICNKISKYKSLRFELKAASTVSDLARTLKIQNELDLLEKEGVLESAAAQGQQLLADENIVILADGQKIKAHYIYLKETQVVIEPVKGQKFSYRGRTYKTGDLLEKSGSSLSKSGNYSERIIVDYNGNIIGYKLKFISHFI